MMAGGLLFLASRERKESMGAEMVERESVPVIDNRECSERGLS